MFLEGLLKITFRNFIKNFTTNIIKILGLVISIAAVIIIWAYVIYENKFDKGIRNSDWIYRLETNWASMPSFLGDAINKNLTNQVIGTRLNFWGDVGILINNNPFNVKDLTFQTAHFLKYFNLSLLPANPKALLI